MGAARPAVPDGFVSTWQHAFGLAVHALESDGAGSVTTAVLVPGLVTASRSLIRLARALTRRGMAVRIVDPLGFGYSDKLPHALSPSEQAAVVAETLRVRGSRPAMIIGTSFGSQVAAALASDHPQVADRLVLLGPTLDPRLRRWLAALDVCPRVPRRCAMPGGRKRARLLARLHGALGAEPPMRMLGLAEYGCASLPRALSTLCHAAAEPVERALVRVEVPTLVIRADGDRLSSLGWAQRLATLAHDGRFVGLPGAGHDALARVPDSAADAIAEFARTSAAAEHEAAVSPLTRHTGRGSPILTPATPSE